MSDLIDRSELALPLCTGLLVLGCQEAPPTITPDGICAARVGSTLAQVRPSRLLAGRYDTDGGYNETHAYDGDARIGMVMVGLGPRVDTARQPG